MGTVTAFEIKFEGVPCQEMGRVVASSARYLIALLGVYKEQQESVLRKRGRSEH